MDPLKFCALAGAADTNSARTANITSSSGRGPERRSEAIMLDSPFACCWAERKRKSTTEPEVRARSGSIAPWAIGPMSGSRYRTLHESTCTSRLKILKNNLMKEIALHLQVIADC